MQVLGKIIRGREVRCLTSPCEFAVRGHRLLANAAADEEIPQSIYEKVDQPGVDHKFIDKVILLLHTCGPSELCTQNLSALTGPTFCRYASGQQRETEGLDATASGRVIRRGNSSLQMEATVDVAVMSS